MQADLPQQVWMECALAIHAIECKLDGIARVIEDDCTQEAQWMFATSVMDKTLLAQFVSADKIGYRDTPVPCYVVHLLEMGVSVHQRLHDSVDNLTEDSEEAEDDESDDTTNNDLTQIADAGELLWKSKFKQLTKDMHEYYTSDMTSNFCVGVGSQTLLTCSKLTTTKLGLPTSQRVYSH